MAMKFQEARNLAGICGIFCGTCPQYLASRENDTKQMARIARDENLPVSKVRCDGCLSDHVISFCKDCRHGFRSCARGKGVTWCFECADFPCERLQKHKEKHIVNGISHHAHIIDSLNFMKNYGVVAWVEQQDKAGSCPQCGKRLYWFTRVCPGCATQIKR
jgi:hypothetical protein